MVDYFATTFCQKYPYSRAIRAGQGLAMSLWGSTRAKLRSAGCDRVRSDGRDLGVGVLDFEQGVRSRVSPARRTHAVETTSG
jgi:hypothetical protein